MLKGFRRQVSKPFFKTLQKWIFSGELHDPFYEFFVQLNPEMSHDGRTSPYHTADVGFEEGLGVRDGSDDAHKLWEKKYVYVEKMVPGFVSEDFAKKVSWRLSCILATRTNGVLRRSSQLGEA